MEETRYFRRGLGRREQVVGILHADYHSGLVEFLRENGYRYDWNDTTVRLAREFGFCYGVDRAVEYAYEAHDRFPDRTIWLTGEIIHNPGVNRKLADMGIGFLPSPDSVPDHLAAVGADDVVIIPAFGLSHEDQSRLRQLGCILVDTTCGSVLTVWKSVERFARGGVTSIIHGKVAHEETRATCSQITRYPGAHWMVVRDREEARSVCDFLRGQIDSAALLGRFEGKHSTGFDPSRDLERIGCANQTTMLSSESLEIAGMLRDAVRARDGGEAEARFHNFDTICSATQERQDAVLGLIDEGCDQMVVIGGFNSSNTNHLVEIAAAAVPVWHIEDAANLVSARWIRHKPLGAAGPVMTESWLPEGRLRIGVTAGASTPNSEIGNSIGRLLTFRGVPREELEALARQGNQASEERKARERAKASKTERPGASDSAG